MNLAVDAKFVSTQVVEARRFFLDLNPSPDKPLAVVCGGMERLRADYVVRRSDFPYFGIEFVAEGEGTLDLSGGKHRLSAGSVFAYGPGIYHCIQNAPKSRMKKYFLDIYGADVRQLLREAGLDFNRPLHIAAKHEFIDIFEMLDREGNDKHEESAKICAHIARLLLAKVKQRQIDTADQISKSYKTFMEIRNHIDEHYIEITEVKDIAIKFRVTPIYLSRLFRRFASSGAYEFLLRRKMNRAAEMLAVEGQLVKDVAEELGYADAFQFSRAFKRVYGIPPKRLIKSRG
jgi:YesN/AraC family two-component response regulator